MGIRGQGYEGCNLDPWYRTRESIPYFSEKHIFDLKFNNKKRSSDVLASIWNKARMKTCTHIWQVTDTNVGGRGGGSMTHRHIETITFGTCLVICAPPPPHTHARTHFSHRHRHRGAALFSSLGWGGVFAFVTFFRGGGGLRTTLGEGGLNSGVWEGVLFFVS